MKLTFKEHELIGKALKLINQKVLVNDYVFKNKAEMRKSHQYKVGILNTELKDRMEEIMYQDHPEQANTSVYYGELKK